MNLSASLLQVAGCSLAGAGAGKYFLVMGEGSSAPVAATRLRRPVHPLARLHVSAALAILIEMNMTLSMDELYAM